MSSREPFFRSSMTRGTKIAAGISALLVVMCIAMVAAGGYVRLTGSGMAIPDWPFITISESVNQAGEVVKNKSIFPPSSSAEWETVRATYMSDVPGAGEISMADFKRMFWIEYGHRALAKLIGVVYLGLLATLLFAEVRKRSVGLIVGGLLLLIVQAVLGGLAVLRHLPAENVAVHLTVGFVFTGVMIWLLLRLVRPDVPSSKRTGRKLQRLAWITAAMLTIQIFYGGLVAGSMGGHVMNDWPLMGGQVVPSEAWSDSYGFLGNIFHNPVFVQFVHRWFAFIVAVHVILLAIKAMKYEISRFARVHAWLLLGLTAFQILLGIGTLMAGVPLALGLIHQMIGLALFALVVVFLYEVTEGKVLAREAAAEASPAAGPAEETVNA